MTCCSIFVLFCANDFTFFVKICTPKVSFIFQYFFMAESYKERITNVAQIMGNNQMLHFGLKLFKEICSFTIHFTVDFDWLKNCGFFSIMKAFKYFLHGDLIVQIFWSFLKFMIGKLQNINLYFWKWMKCFWKARYSLVKDSFNSHIVMFLFILVLLDISNSR